MTDSICAPCKASCTAVMVIAPARVDETWPFDDTQMMLRQDYQFVEARSAAR